jgi:hypothetical protein
MCDSCFSNPFFLWQFIPEELVAACTLQDMKTISMPRIPSALVSHCLGLQFAQKCKAHDVYLASRDELRLADDMCGAAGFFR